MKLKLLLFLLFISCGVFTVKAQYDYVYNPDTIRHLVISETRMDQTHYSYIEISNMSETEAVNLGTFELGSLDAWTLPWPLPGVADNEDHSVAENRRIKLPTKILWPGESFVVATVFDLAEKMKFVDPERWEGRVQTQTEMWDLADIQIHPAQGDWGDYTQMDWKDGIPMDSVSPYGSVLLDTWNGRSVFYIRQHLSEIDSLVVDQIGGEFIEDDGTVVDGPRDVAGVEGATATHILFRKFSVKEGDVFGDDWALQQGTDLEDSEWLPVRVPRNAFGLEGIKVKPFWTIGNHGNFTLNPNSFQSDVIDINFTDTVMTVPWGTRNDYQIMNYFEKSPGIAWEYDFSPNREDSTFTSARTGDVLNLYACGNTLERWAFDIVVAEPTDDANIVIPKNRLQTDPNDNEFGTYIEQDSPFDVTIGAFGMDTIYNIVNAERIDTLYKYLEKAPEATWIVDTHGEDRPDLKDGDLLKVTAKDGSVKSYYIKVDEFLPSHNAYLSAITWPDIPEDYRGFYGWTGDTIPGFGSNQYEYTLSVPADVDGIPALVTKTEALNTSVQVDRATNVLGSVAERTITFNTAAEDDTTSLSYSVVLEKEKAEEDIQPFYAEPFFSQRAMRAFWRSSGWEICNPGNQPLDLSNYMIVRGNGNGTPADAIMAGTTTEDWESRYNKYIPGRVWENEANWMVQPAKAVQDLAVNPIVMPGDVFVVGNLGPDDYASHISVIQFEIDVDFLDNPWGDTLIGGNPVLGWYQDDYYLFKIVNDSVRNGTKPATDPGDFELIDVFGYGDDTRWVMEGSHDCNQVERYTRKRNIWHGNTTYGGSFGTDVESCEWIWEDRGTWGAQGIGWDTDVKMPWAGMGVHSFDPVTVYRSFVTSSAYKVSPGYTDETIRGLITGTTVDEFLAMINKEDENQTLTVKSGETALGGTDAITNEDVLEVVSANGDNTTIYVLEVTDDGLSNDAELTSTEYAIVIDGSTGTITVPPGILLADAKANVVVPAGASFNIVDANDAYLSLKTLMYDSTYTDATVNDMTYFEVVAEDGVTSILYKLELATDASAAFVTSNVYKVDQDASNIMYVPRGTAVRALLNNLIPAPGATVKVIDKLGNERTLDNVYQDDKVVVTSADGTTVKVYYMSMLITKAYYGETTDYLAYVLSDVYSVDQQELVIAGESLTGDVQRLAFLSDLIPSMGATVTVLTSDGFESTTDDLNQGDVVQVTAADGETVVLYTLTFATSVEELPSSMQLYPNPTEGTVNINGIESGNRIRVFNSMGATIRDFVVTSSNATFTLANESAGMYMVLVNDANKVTGRFKVIRK